MRKIDFVDENNCSCASQDPRGPEFEQYTSVTSRSPKSPMHSLYYIEMMKVPCVPSLVFILLALFIWLAPDNIMSYLNLTSLLILPRTRFITKANWPFSSESPAVQDLYCLKGVGNISTQNSPSPLKLTSQNWLSHQGIVIVVQSFDSNQCWVAVPLLLIHFSLISILSSIYPFSAYAKQLHHTL